MLMQQLNRDNFKRDRLTLLISDERHIINIELAETQHQKALGLMYRTALGEREGMLFPYDRPQEIQMWMKNTCLILDIIFIKTGGIVHRIEDKAASFSETVIASNGDVIAVLELAGGVAGKLGLRTGDRVIHKLCMTGNTVALG